MEITRDGEADPIEDDEREACIKIDPPGFHIRHPPPPDKLDDFITHEDDLFQTIHMGPALVNPALWKLVIDGLVERPFTLSLQELRDLPAFSVSSFHECYGPPTAPPTKAYWRIGNVKWTGVRLNTILDRARPLPEAQYVWSDGLDYGTFAGRWSDRYQKDLPLSKAMQDEVLVAYAMNDEPLGKHRGGPVRLIVPGWFGTNSTKWLCKLSLQKERSSSLFTTIWYNEKDPADESGQRMRPVWAVEPNSMINRPRPDEVVSAREVVVQGRAWSCEGIERVEVEVDDEVCWRRANLAIRSEYQWQGFECRIRLGNGEHEVKARAHCKSGEVQPLSGRRNHAHSVSFRVASQ